MKEASLRENIFSSLPDHLPQINKVFAIESVSGGDTNLAFHVKTDVGAVFLKTNHPEKLDFFIKEASGLRHLKQASFFKIPKVLGYGENEHFTFLALEWIDSDSKIEVTKSFGFLLAKMHKQSSETFGWKEDNYIGPLPQCNECCNDWIDFFIGNRIEPQFKSAFDAGCFELSDYRSLENLYKELPNILPLEPPALIHGDLWSGNYLYHNDGLPVLIDPSISYSHREMDIGMMQLFGGFGAQVFDDYHQEYPLESNWKNRLLIHNLYPLLVHVNLFRGGYIQQVKMIIREFL